jgi:serine/threonine-protein kinase HipA
LPDGWGSLVLDRYLRTKGIEPVRLSVLQRLALVGSTGRGALEYYPNKNVSEEDTFLDFNKLAAEAEKILGNEYTSDGLETFYRYGGSSGGARPKFFAIIDGRQWLIKFKAAIDPPNIGKVEYDYSQLARQCGINMPETRLFEGKYFGVERFDRTENGKIHTISAAGLLNADYRIPSLDYSTLLKVCLDLTKNIEEVYALFRLMVFNVAISNRDDHAKNFSFQYKNAAWCLSPAYDLLPSSGFNGYHTTTINGQGNPTLKDIMQAANDVGLNKKRAESIVEQVMDIYKKRGF